ncbi:FtsW/RodA/SpoVE family cell cycle protein [Sporosarcina psychrophila]|uniref:FtsW/RodA/SpoVE family cell cycle protein n=1 Tax=Sporosarcina psychrophila TaxID=1476 RepID=UPI00078E7384|nr:FtsW/RodA/SpoVE family cell cycle protein [Sporosarcina psychrophila]AMQ06403.1 cell division protein FtsW [Sporosarcina psychrophila]
MGKRRLSFLNEVRDQIKSREAKDFVEIELDYHIKEAKSHLLTKGIDETEAEEKAVGQMGSPVMLGQQLNKLHRPKVDWLTVVLLITTMGIGFLPLFSLGYMNNGHFAIYKIIFVLLGAGGALGLMLINYRELEKLGWLFYTIGVLVLIMIKALSKGFVFGTSVVEIGPVTIESVMSIPFFFLAWASFINNKRLKIWHLGMLFVLSFYLLFTIPSTSTAYIYTVMVFAMVWWSKYSRKTILVITILTSSSFIIFGLILWPLLAFYQKLRLLEFINPEKYPTATTLYIKERMSQAGWFGNSMNKETIVDAHTNFVFVSFTYHYGWLFGIALVVLLSLFASRIVVVLRKIKDPYGKLLLIGAIALYTIQFVSNIGMSLGYFPMISMSLPFISYGLMPILLNAFLIGVVLSVYRRKDLTSSRFSHIESGEI